MKKKIFTIAAGSLAFIAATLLVSFGANAQTISTIAGTGVLGYSGDGGSATSAQLRNPAGVKTGAAGTIYIADYLNHRIRKIGGGIITTVAGNGVNTFAGDGSSAVFASLNQPAGVTFSSTGVMYISDYGNHRIRRVSTGGIISTIAGTGTGGYSGDGGAATAAQIQFPTGINIDPSGNIYFAEQGNNVIRKITIATGIISTVAGNGTAGYSGDGGDATAAKLNQPKDVVVDASGNLYIADFLNHCIRKVNTSGIITTIAGTSGAAFTGDGGPATSANLNNPISVWVETDGSIIFSDNGNARIRRISTSGIISTIAGTGTFGYSGDGGHPTAANLRPGAVTTDVSGNIYIADGSNHRLRKITPPPVTIAGSATVCIGNTVTLSGSVSGGTWSSSSTSVGTVDATGIVTGVTVGTTTISYVAASGTATQVVTVNALPGTITGTASACVSGSTTLSNTSSGGTWSSSASGTAGIDGAGVVTGVAAGTAVITYTLAGCTATTIYTVNATPSAISGTTTVCIAATTALSSATAGGSWSSSSPSVAGVDAAGLVTGVTAGTTNVSYTLPTGCHTSNVITVVACAVSIDDVSMAPTDFKVFPNPAFGSFNIQLPNANEEITITLSDVTGKEIGITAISNSNIVRCIIPNLTSGNYYLKVTAGNNTFRKIIQIVQK